MTLIGSTLLLEAQKMLGRCYKSVRCHDLVLRPFVGLEMFAEGQFQEPGVPDNIHEQIEDFDVKSYVESCAECLKEEYALRWLTDHHNTEPGDILLLAMAGEDRPCHLGWVANPRGPVRHMLHAWNPDPARPQIGSVRYDIVHPRVFKVMDVARIDAR